VDHLGDRVLDLEARVHLEEIELPVGREQKLDGAGVAIAAGARRRDRHRPHLGAERGRQRGRRGFLDDLLVPPLDRAVALAKVHGVSRRVGEHLDLDVTGTDDRLFQIYRIVAERGLGLATRAVVGGGELRFRLDEPHPLPSAAGGGLEHDGKANAPRRHERLRRGGKAPPFRSVVPWDNRDAGLGDRLAGRRLVPHHAHRRAARADECDPGRLACVGKVFVLREKSVAGVDRIGAGSATRREDLLDVEVALARRRRSDSDGAVRQADV
jgi:hypothetical protein